MVEKKVYVKCNKPCLIKPSCGEHGLLDPHFAPLAIDTEMAKHPAQQAMKVFMK